MKGHTDRGMEDDKGIYNRNSRVIRCDRSPEMSLLEYSCYLSNTYKSEKCLTDRNLLHSPGILVSNENL